MNCQAALRQLDAFVDGELAPAVAESIAAHVVECPACTRQADAARLLKRKVRVAMSAQPAPPGLETRVRARIRGEGARAAGWWKWAVPAAAAMVLITGGVLIERQVMGALGVGTGMHIHCTLERQKPAFGQLQRPLDPEYGDLLTKVQAAMPAGYELRESHYCRGMGRRFQHIVYSRGDERVSVLVTPKKDGESFPRLAFLSKMREQGIPIYASRLGGLGVAGFESGRNMAFVVSGMDAGENLRLLAALAPAVRGNL